MHGDSLKTYLVGILGVQPDIFAGYASKVLKSTIAPTDIPAIKSACTNPKVVAAVLKDIAAVSKQKKLMGYERVRNVRLEVDPFSVENEMLTPTLKTKRVKVARDPVWKGVLEELYAEAERWEAAEGPKAKL